jgi:anti-sigma factor RsiW
VPPAQLQAHKASRTSLVRTPRHRCHNEVPPDAMRSAEEHRRRTVSRSHLATAAAIEAAIVDAS